MSVVDGDDRLRISNESDAELVVLGYDGEPYLRIGPLGVHRNERSPATYLNRDRFARVAVPLRADSGARGRHGHRRSRRLGLLLLRLRHGEEAATQAG